MPEGVLESAAAKDTAVPSCIDPGLDENIFELSTNTFMESWSLTFIPRACLPRPVVEPV